MKSILLVILSCFLLQITQAQKESIKQLLVDKDSYDSTYIETFKDYLSIENTIGRSGINAMVGERKGSKLRFAINSKVQLGYRLSWKFIGFSFALNLPVLNNDEEKFGKTSGFNINFNSQVKRKWLIDFNFLKQKGLFLANAPSLIDGFKRKYNFPLYPDMKILYFGADGKYLFNHQKFSLKVAQNASERQLKSAGSFFLGGYFFFNQLKNPSNIVLDTIAIQYQELNQTNLLYSINLGLTAGYGYNLVIKKYGMVSGLATVGFGPGISKIGYDNGNKDVKIIMSGRYKFSLSGGYYGNKVCAGIRTVIAVLPNSANNNIRAYYESDYAGIFFNYKFLPEISEKKQLMKANESK